MRLNREALMAACDRAMFEDKKRHDEREAKNTQERESKLAAWRDAYAEAWMDAALEIRRVLRKGGSVTGDMLPRNDYRQTATHTSGPSARDYSPPTELLALRRVLATVADDTVSMSSLERLGISRTTIRAAAQQLAAKSVEDVA